MTRVVLGEMAGLSIVDHVVDSVYQLDYAGWETVDFETMEWKYDDGHPFPANKKDIKRDENGKWTITDDWDVWVEYDQGNGEEETIESYYQEWITSAIVKIAGS